MIILAADTSIVNRPCIGIYFSDGETGAELNLSVSKTGKNMILTGIDAVLRSTGIRLEDVDIFAAGIGPGSFTGLKIGLATIKSFAWIHKKPLIGISSLHALAYSFINTQHQLLSGKNTLIVSAVDARMNKCYSGFFDSKPRAVSQERDLSPQELCLFIEEKQNDKTLYIIGNGPSQYPLIKEKFPQAHIDTETVITGKNLCRLAYEIYQTGDYQDFHQVSPVYLRKSVAEEKMEEQNQPSR